MFTRPLILTVVVLGLVLIIQSLVPKVAAMKTSPNIDEYLMEDQRTRRRKNYVLQMARNSDIFKNGDLLRNSDIGPEYNTEPVEPESHPEDLSALIVDYANMIRNDVILLDNSVETRTRKRGNFKVEKKYNQAIPDIPCDCEFVKETIILGSHFVPHSLETKNCSQARQSTCVPPYVCTEKMFHVTVLRRRDNRSDPESPDLPSELRYRWITETIPISVGCTCTNEQLTRSKDVVEG